MSTGYSRDMLKNVIAYFDFATNRETAIDDGTLPAIAAKVRRSCAVYNIGVPSWAK